MRVSIVIPVYNGSNYLREAIDSALAQTYKNLEVIVVNDGSDDGGKTEEIAKSYGNRIRYFYKENGGVASALNRGIREMKGEWFAWLSHDDMFAPNRIEEDMHVIRENPEAKIIFCNVSVIDNMGKLISQHKYPIQRVTNPREVMVLRGINMCATTIHKSCLERVGLFNEKNKTTQDTEMSLLLSKYYTLYLNDNAISYCREHSERNTHKMRDQHKKGRLLLADVIRSNFSLYDFFPDLDDKDKRQLSKALEWLGNLYGGFGAYGYADECYKRGFSARRNPFSAIGVKYILGARNLNSSPLRTAVKIKAVFGDILKRLKGG